MPLPLRSVAIRLNDALAEDFADTLRANTVLGASLACTEIARLHELAAAVVSNVSRWRGLMMRLEVAPTRRFDEARARALVLEAVFDEVLSPAAWRVLKSAVEVAASAPPSRSLT